MSVVVLCGSTSESLDITGHLSSPSDMLITQNIQ